MADKNIKVIREKEEVLKPAGVVVSNIVISSVDRTPKDVKSWRAAHISAESAHYPNRTRLYNLYEDVILDGHLTGIINKRISAVRNKRLIFTKADKKVDEMDEVIRSKAFRDIITLILEAPAWGVSGMEFINGEKLAFDIIPRKHIKPEFGVISINESDYSGYEYSKIPNVFVVGEKLDLGYLLKCSFYALIKKGDFGDWGQFVEIFGQPVRVIKYDAYDDKTKIQLKQVLDESGSSLALMIPKQTEFEMLDGKTSNSDGQLQERLKDACNQEMSIIVLGNTETSTSSSSSGYAQAKEHGKQQLEVTKDDMAYVLNYLNDDKFLAILASYGLPVNGGTFEYEKEIDLEELKGRKEIDSFVSQKVPIGDDYYYDTYGIPKPDNYDELKAKMEEEKAAAAAPPAGGSFPPKKPGKKLSAEDNFWNRFRSNLADFFDPAH